MTPPKKPTTVAPVTHRISDVVWQALIAGAVTCVLAYFGQRAATKAEEAAQRVDEVRTTLSTTTGKTEAKLNELTEITNDVHALVNSNMEIQLKISMVALRRLSELTKDDDDVAAYKAAKELYEDHLKKQGIVDDKKK